MTNVAPSHNWRPGQRPRVKKDPAHTIKAAMGLLRSVSKRADFDVTDFGLMHRLGTPDDIMQLAADRLRDRGVTWQQLADACGITRQTAWLRWRAEEVTA